MTDTKRISEVLFTHDDLDGAGCRVLFELTHLKGGDDWALFNCSNAGIDTTVNEFLDSGVLEEHSNVIFADICCSRETLRRVIDAGHYVFVFDHHRTNFWAEQEHPPARIIPENELGVLQSGTSIFYQFLCEMSVKNPLSLSAKIFDSSYRNADFLSKFVDTVRSYDTFEWKQTNNMEAKKLQILFQLLGMERFCQRYVSLIANESSTLKDLITTTDLEFVSAKIEAEQNRIDAFTPQDVIECTVRGYKTAFAPSTIGMNVSELAYQFLHKYPEYDIFASFSFANGGEFSFRTIREDLDLGKDIAAPIGGGGHPPAAGAPICDELRSVLIDYLVAEMNGEAYHIDG